MIALAPQGVYWTVQGEGHLAGEPSIFVRLAGCSVGCPSCDTNYKHHEDVAEEEVVRRCSALREENRRAMYVWITGGEPTDQSLTLLNKLLWQAGFKPCLATSGVRKVIDQWWWLSVSPHTTDFVQRQGAEIKVVPGLNGVSIKELDLSGCSFSYHYVQPMAGSRESLEECLEWLRDNRVWTMSPQSHKSWGLP